MAVTEQATAAARYPRYPAYKDSGIEWLREIPAHWEVKRLKRVFRITNGSTPDSSRPEFWDGEIPWATPEDLGDLQRPDIIQTKRRISDLGLANCAAALVPAGSILVSTRAPIGSLGLAGTPMCTNQGCRGLVARTPVAERYWYYHLIAATQELESLGQGSTFQELSGAKLGTVALASPPLPEQRAIAAFLDRETARIDELIGKKEQLAALLEEQKASVVTRLVKRGAERNEPLRGSGVESLGPKPTSGSVERLRQHLQEKPRNGLSPAPAQHGGVPTFSTAALHDSVVTLKGNIKYADVSPAQAHPFNVAVGDVFILRGSGSRSLVGRAGILMEEPPEGCIYPDILIRLRPSPSITPWFLVAMLNSQSVRPQIECAARTAAGIWKITGEDVCSLRIPVPPVEVQGRIEREAIESLRALDTTLQFLRTAIDRARERRGALVSAAVTGKIDVRAAAAVGRSA